VLSRRPLRELTGERSGAQDQEAFRSGAHAHSLIAAHGAVRSARSAFHAAGS
jgi:hypothetical protein